MREIKFRAWDKRSLKWFDMSRFALHATFIEVSIPGMSASIVIEKDYDLMQYTGLKDKHGVEIYEGEYRPPQVP